MSKEKEVLSRRDKTRQMTILAMFIAIIAVLSLVPNGAGGTLGYIKIAGNLEATIIHIPILIGGALLGRKFGIYLGLSFGILSNIAAFIYASPFFYYPWVAILPRFLFGLIIYDVTKFFVKVLKNKKLGTAVSFFLLTFIHTAMVLPMMLTGFAITMDMSLSASVKPFIELLITFLVPLASLIEMVIAAIIGSVIVLNILHYVDFPSADYLKDSDQ